MSHSSAYPSPPYSLPEHMDPSPNKSLFASTWHVLEQPPPPTLREILSAYKSKGDGDRDMLLAMLNAKAAEDQRITAIASLHQKLLDARVPPPSPTHDHLGPFAHTPFMQPTIHQRVSPTSSPIDVKLPPIQAPTNPSRKRPHGSQSPPMKSRKGSVEQLPPSPPFSSPGRPTPNAAELQPQARPMAIGSLLASSTSTTSEAEAEWPSRTSAERTGSVTETFRRQSSG